MSALDYSALTPGIRETVRLLRSWGYETCDSGDGVTNVAAGMEDARNYPHVTIQTDDPVETADGLAAALAAIGIEVRAQGPDPWAQVSIQATYCPVTRLGLVEVYGLHDARLAAAAGGAR